MPVNKIRNEKYMTGFKDEVLFRKNRIDPKNSEDWYSLALGWAIAKGVPPEEAHIFARIIKYYTQIY